ncbi:hypothetical protein MXMO3_00190 [Maritalea myrionectae]|uniref:Shikimate kinase n=1 Tax=Maritalea myrionectae TaxID=454601 RepID=A0A2R4M9M8_9HYPH|nr:AAA family ATPase [Maritalea myrionectae]AVX02738.1 hypothetical protein MXMO3_00190 [Maritalea myrionectae]
MKFVVLIGPQAVGKMTVGQELEKLSEFKLFHNHQTVDLVSQYFSFSTPEGQKLVEDVRLAFFNAFAASDAPGFIFTLMRDFEDPADTQFLDHVTGLFEAQGADVYWIELETNIETRLVRNRSENRLKNKPSKRNVEKSEKHLLRCHDQFRLNSYDGEIKRENYLKIKNSKMSAAAVAAQIQNFISA